MNKNLFFHKKNNSRIASYRINGIESVVIYITFKGGFYYEENSKRGIFHLIEHLIFKGCSEFKNQEEINLYLEKNAIDFNAGTSNENLFFSFKFPKNKYKETIFFIEKILFNSLLEESNINSEIAILNRENSDYWNNVFNRFNYQILKQYFGSNHEFCKSLRINYSLLTSINRNYILDIYNRYINPNEMNCVLVGDIDGDLFLKDIELIIINNKRKINIYSNKDYSINKNIKDLIYKDKIEKPRVLLSWKLWDYKNELIEDMSEHLVNLYLTGMGMNSFLFKEIREKEGLCCSISSYFSSFSNKYHFFSISSSIEKNDINYYIDKIKESLDIFLNNGINKEKENRMINYVNYHTLMNWDNPFSIASKISNDLLVGDKINMPKDYEREAKKIEIAFLINRLKEYLTPEKMIKSILLPE